ncbi:hypothetical protein CsSME_00022343 [Camellia sinensis var. sinensis]
MIITPKLPSGNLYRYLQVWTMCCGEGIVVRMWLLGYACPLLSAKPRGRDVTRKCGCSRFGARPTTWVGPVYLS